MYQLRETHRYLTLHKAYSGRVIYVTCAYVRQVERAWFGAWITVADRRSRRHVRETPEQIMHELTAGTVRYEAEA